MNELMSGFSLSVDIYQSIKYAVRHLKSLMIHV